MLLNFAKHENLPAHVDGYSSGPTFPHWRKLIGRFPLTDHRRPLSLENYGLAKPRSWLARAGWMRA